ncbi:hypothetical protein HMPREF1603_00070 [Escherichia coli 907892]|nr:hypothetical protein HMPREF1603_00070 [Escherichia coli 907892]
MIKYRQRFLFVKIKRRLMYRDTHHEHIVRLHQENISSGLFIVGTPH